MSKQVEREKRRLDRLRKELQSQQKKIDKEKAQIRKDRRELDLQKRKIDRDAKSLKVQSQKMKIERGNMGPASPRRSKRVSVSRGKLALSEKELGDYKKKYADKDREVRALRRKIDALEDDNRKLKRRAKQSMSALKKGNGKEDREVRRLKKEVRVLKRKLKLMLKDLDKQQRYYHAQLRRFKAEQDRWLRLQKDAMKKDKILVKYLFIDDIKTIRVFPKKRAKKKHKVRVKTNKGEEVVIYVHDAEVVNEPDVDDEIGQADEMLEQFKEQVKRRKRRKGKKPDDPDTDTDYQSDEDDETPGTPMGAKSDGDDDEDDGKEPATPIFEEDEEFEDLSGEQISELLSELHSRTKDVQRMSVIYREEPLETQGEQLKELAENVNRRHIRFADSLENLKFDMDDLKDLSTGWQESFKLISEAVEDHSEHKLEVAKVAWKEEQAGLAVIPEETEAEIESLKEEKKSLQQTNRMALDELKARTRDLKSLNSIYFPPIDEEEEESSQGVSALKREDRIQAIQKSLEARHAEETAMMGGLTVIPEESFVSEWTDVNDEWSNLMQVTARDHESHEQAAVSYVDELCQRTSELELIWKVVSGDESRSALEAAWNKAKKRHAAQYKEQFEDGKVDEDDSIVKDNREWEDLLHRVNEATTPKVPEKSEEMKDDFDFHFELIRELLAEMKRRRKDLSAIRTMDTGIPEECEGLKMETETRHNDQKDKLLGLKKKCTSTGDADKDAFEDARRETILDGVIKDNAEWQSMIGEVMQLGSGEQRLKKTINCYFEELDGRIADLLKIKGLSQQKREGELEDDEQLQNATQSILESVNDRHTSNTGTVKAINDSAGGPDKVDKETQERFVEYVENDRDWMDAIGTLVREINSQPLAVISEEEEVDGPVTPSAADGASPRMEEDEPFAEAGKMEAEEKEANEWWLDKNPSRVEEVDGIIMDDKKRANALLLGDYVNRIYWDSEDANVNLYVPQPDNIEPLHGKMSALYDGGLLCALIDWVDPGFIDKRVIYKPDPFDPKPLSAHKVAGNVQLLLACLKAMGVYLDHGQGYDDWSDLSNHYSLMSECVNELHTLKLNSLIGLEGHSEVKQLGKGNEKEDDLKKVSPQEWLQRWMNHRLGRPVLDPITDWNEDLYQLLFKHEPAFKSKAPHPNFNDAPKQCAKFMIHFIRDRLGLSIECQPVDLIRNNELLQELLGVHLFTHKSGLEKEKVQRKSQVGKKKKKKEPLSAFVNSLLPAELHISNVNKDFATGVILCKLLDRVKPGCIKWRMVKMKPKNKFEQMINCNYGMGIIKKEFPFSLVGMSGQDIHDGHGKFIHTMLWQMMRYHATKKLSELNFGGKAVSDADILSWANVTLSGLDDRHCQQIKGFKDKELTTGIFYLELLKSILPKGAVRDDLIDFDIAILANPRAPDKYADQRLANARYAMTLIRMNGGELFVLPEDLISLDSKAVLSVIAACMTIAYGKSKKMGGVTPLPGSGSEEVVDFSLFK